MFLPQEELGTRSSQLTAPVELRERWPSCWVSGPIREAGCRERGWSIPGVSTEPWRQRQRTGSVGSVLGGCLRQ